LPGQTHAAVAISLLYRLLCLFPCACAVQSLPVPHQTLLFSATMPKEIEQLAAQYLNKPVKVKIGRVSVPTANVAQTLQRCGETEKVELLVALLQVSADGHCVSATWRLSNSTPFCMSAWLSHQDHRVAAWVIEGVEFTRNLRIGSSMLTCPGVPAVL
jgi:hypothetical protein